MSRSRARSTLVTFALALLVERVCGWLLAGSSLADRMLATPDAWAVLPLLYMVLRIVLVVAGPPLVAVALASLAWPPTCTTRDDAAGGAEEGPSGRPA